MTARAKALDLPMRSKGVRTWGTKHAFAMSTRVVTVQ